MKSREERAKARERSDKRRANERIRIDQAFDHVITNDAFRVFIAGQPHPHPPFDHDLDDTRDDLTLLDYIEWSETHGHGPQFKAAKMIEKLLAEEDRKTQERFDEMNSLLASRQCQI